MKNTPTNGVVLKDATNHGYVNPAVYFPTFIFFFLEKKKHMTLVEIIITIKLFF